MDPSTLTVYTCPYPKQRLGKNNDGGYIIANIPNIQYDVLISAGISDDITFEEDWLRENPTTRCIAFDGTIQGCTTKSERLEWKRKNIDTTDTDTTTNLHELLSTNTSIFLKMDIEGAEVRWFETLKHTHIEHLSQIVIEFHSPFSSRENEIFKTLNKTHVLVHLHANNWCNIKVQNGIVVPEVFECTYIHKRYMPAILTLNRNPLPSALDQPNNSSRKDINLNYPPFVHNV